MGLNFGQVARSQAIAWKLSTDQLPPEAREPADYVNSAGLEVHGPFEFCLPPEFATANLLADCRDQALEVFAQLGIPWQGGSAGAPSNHLLDTQTQMANALVPLQGDPERLGRFLRLALPVAEVLPIEHDWFVTFGWMGAHDHLEEARGIERTRASRVTKADAAIRFRGDDGRIGLALVCWKYGESGTEPTSRRVDLQRRPGKERNRRRGRPSELEGSARKRNAVQAHYRGLLPAAELPVRPDIPWSDLFVEPFEELLRLQLLAALAERAGELDADTVHLILVAPSENLDFAFALTRQSHHRLGSTVFEVWSKLVTPPDRFAYVDSSAFVDPDLDLTAEAFRERYGDLGPAAES